MPPSLPDLRSGPVLGARHLAKAYGTQTLLRDVSLSVAAGERVGLLGINGTGKSTLLRVLAGIEVADTGTVDRRRDASILYLAQEPTLTAEATAREVVEEGLAAWKDASTRHAEVTRRIEREGATDALVLEQSHLAERVEHLGGWSRGHLASEMLDKLGVRDADRAVGTMSGGERRRVALARILVARPDLAILDEPTNHLDADTIAWLEEYLASDFGGAVLVVTHDRYVMDALCNRILELDRGALTEYAGGYADYLEQKAERLAHEERVGQNRLNLLRRETAWLRRGAKARSTKQKARIQRAEALAAAEPTKAPQALDLTGLESSAPRLGKTVLDLEHVDVAIAGRVLVKDVTLHLQTGERVGIVGPNGAGKTSLLRVVTGELEPAAGKVVRGGRTRIAHFDQARANLEDGWSVLDNVAGREGAERQGAGVVTIGERTVEMRAYLEQFLFDGAKQRQKVGSLSGGERARVALAKVLRAGDNLLLLDEPTNDLDVTTLATLEELLESWPGAALVVSHDRAFLDRVATHILAMEPDGHAVLYAGNYATYRSQRPDAPGKRAAPEAAPAAPRARRQAAPGPKPLTYAERIELDGILDVVAEAEAEVARLEARLADPALYAETPAEVGPVRAALEAAQAEVTKRTARWEELEARRPSG